jgi:PTH1 family peptidyl-tRNA hydrolase
MAWIVVGLGNPGEEYVNTRHNTGRMALEIFAKKHGAADWKAHAASKSLTSSVSAGKNTVVLVLPETYMNKSGLSTAKFVKSVKAAEKLIVVYDDLDLSLGKIKVSFDRGSGGHKGIESITRSIKTKKFVRIRVGVSPATPGGKIKKPQGEEEVVKFILAKFKPSEMDELKKVFKRVGEAIEITIDEGLPAAMNQCN